MHAVDSSRVETDHAQTTKTQSKQNEFLTTKQLPEVTGLSTSYFEKGRTYGYGPKFINLKSRGKRGKIIYRRSDVDAWLKESECQPGGCVDA